MAAWFDVKAYPAHKGGLSVFFRDITERKEAAAALRRSEERFRALVTATSDVVYSMNPDWSEMRNLHGRALMADANEPSANWLEHYIHIDDRPAVMEAINRAIRTKSMFQLEHRVLREDRTLGWTLSRAVPLIDGEGEILEWFGTASDHTERSARELVQEQLLADTQKARAEAETANRMKDEFLATLSHELRTPLNAILGWAALLKTGRLDEPGRAEGIDAIERNSKVQAQLIEDLLDVSRIISGKLRLDVQRVSPVDIIEAAVAAVMPAANARTIRIHKMLDNSAGLIAGDPARLQQIVWNLLSNAVKFTPRGGRIDVLLERVNSHVEITVADTGQGIKPEFLPYVFDRFSQYDASTTRRHGGLGLGLSIVRQLVEMHGGTVPREEPRRGPGSDIRRGAADHRCEGPPPREGSAQTSDERRLWTRRAARRRASSGRG